MKKIALVFVLIAIIAVTSCEQQPTNCTEQQQKTLINEVETQFEKLLILANKQDFKSFQQFVAEDATLIINGNSIDPKPLPKQVFVIFKELSHSNSEITENFYDVVCCHNTNLYHLVFASFRPTDTVIGYRQPGNMPYEQSNGTVQYADNKTIKNGSRNNQIKPTQVSGNSFMMPQPTSLNQTVVMSILWTKEEEIWKIEHVHLSFAPRQTKTYALN